MKLKNRTKKAFTLIEILVILVIMGFLIAMVAPKLAGVTDATRQGLDIAQMQTIKRASLEFYKDLGFVPDNVSLLIYPFQECDVDSRDFNDTGETDSCKNMISFVDSHYKLEADAPALRKNGLGDIGLGTVRESPLIAIVKVKLDPKQNGWRGGYIGGNAYLKPKNIKILGGLSTERNNRYYLSDQDIEVYYDGWESNISLDIIDAVWTSSSANRELYPVYSADFNGTLGSGAYIEMDDLYGNAKYFKIENPAIGRESSLVESMTVLDSFGTPFEIQIPTATAVGAGNVRTRFARIVSFGADRRRDTPIDVLDINYDLEGYDDSVLYLFEHNLTSYFHPKDEK